MAILTRDRFQPLLQVKEGPCISIYMPTHRHHPGTEQDPTRFKQALKEAERLLSDRHSEEDIRQLLDPVAAMPNLEFWRHQGEGLAILRSRDMLEEFRLPLTMPELVVVAETFHLRPLIRCLSSNQRYFLVALSQNGVRVYEGTMDSLTLTAVPGLPEDIGAFMGTRRRRAVAAAAASDPDDGRQRAPAANGAQSSSEEDLARYFRAIDRALQRALRHDGAPVILAGVDYYLPIYRGITRLKTLADRIVSGSPDGTSLNDLRSRAWAIAEGILRADEDAAIERFARARARGRACETLEDIVREARRGRVRRLFLAAGVRVWGTVEATTGRILRTHEQQGSHDDDILDDVAQSVVTYGGDVITLPLTRMPGVKEAMAELR